MISAENKTEKEEKEENYTRREFNYSNFVRSFTPIAVSEAAQALPNIGGAGWVRDLQEAATQSPELIALIKQAKDAPTRADYNAAVATLMREWGNDSAYNSASKQALAAGYMNHLARPASAYPSEDELKRAYEENKNKLTIGSYVTKCVY